MSVATGSNQSWLGRQITALFTTTNKDTALDALRADIEHATTFTRHWGDLPDMSHGLEKETARVNRAAEKIYDSYKSDRFMTPLDLAALIKAESGSTDNENFNPANVALAFLGHVDKNGDRLTPQMAKVFEVVDEKIKVPESMIARPDAPAVRAAPHPAQSF